VYLTTGEHRRGEKEHRRSRGKKEHGRGN